MKAIPGSNIERSAVDETAAEFLRAQEVQRPSTIEELQQATTSASDEVERVLYRRDRWQEMKEEVDEEAPSSESESKSLYDEWVDVMLDLEESFTEAGDGALGKRVIELLALDDGGFAARAGEAQKIVQQTTPMALRVYPFVHRLVDLGIAHDRAAVVERLSSGDLVRQEMVDNVSITPRRRTVIGLLRDLDARLPMGGQTNVWSLEVSPELPASVVISDPFQDGNKDLSMYWAQRIDAVRKTYKKEVTILSISGDRTTAVLYELENIAEQAGDEVLRHAARSVGTWLEGKQIYYTNPDERDFELYHLGMEDPQQLMEIMRSLDVIKHFDPELFFELLGIDPLEGGRSHYFGSFLHKALYNTQRNIDASAVELGTMALSTMMRQLFTIDDHVQTYASVVSQESLKAMAGEMKKSVDAAPNPESKAQMFMMMAVPYSRMAVDAEVRRQLDALREASSENVVEELRRRIDDIEHPLKLADYLVGLPKHAADDVLVRRELRKIFSEEQIDSGKIRRVVTNEYGDRRGKSFTIELSSVLPELYQRIPLIDEAREDLGFALRIKVVLRDAVAMADGADEITTANTSDKTKARQFIKFVMSTGLYREDYETIKDGMTFWERRVAERFNYADRSQLRMYPSACVHQFNLRRSGEDRSFFVGQMLIDWAGQAAGNNIFQTEPFNHMEDLRPDLVFLSIIAHPKGKEVAFKYFEKFCEIIPAERMCELLRLDRAPVDDFVSLFKTSGPSIAGPYLYYLRDQLSSMQSPHVDRPGLLWMDDVRPEHLVTLIKISRVLIAKHTPWEIQTGYRSSPPEEFKMELFDVYQSVKRAYLYAGLDSESLEKDLRNPDIDPPTEEQMKEMRSCYKGPQTSFGSDELNTKALIACIRTYLFRGKIYLPNSESILTETVINKII